MAIPSGLGGTFGVAEETSPGTYTAPTRWFYFKKEQLALKKTTVVSEVLGAEAVHPASRRVVTAVDVSGSVDLDLTDSGGLGLLVKHSLGSTPIVSTPTAGVTKQVHAFGDPTGSALSVQVGRPSVDGSVNAFSYTGIKVDEWTLAVSTGQIATLALTVDGVNSSISETYVAPSYSGTGGSPLHFAQGSLTLGGTATTSDGEVTISGGATPAGAVKTVEIKGSTGLAKDRRTLGSLTKLEQVRNAFVDISGTAEVEFATMDIYNEFLAGAPLSLELSFTGAEIGSTGTNAQFNVILPAIYIDEPGGPSVEGPDILTQKVAFTAFSDGTNTPVQITIVSADTTV